MHVPVAYTHQYIIIIIAVSSQLCGTSCGFAIPGA